MLWDLSGDYSNDSPSFPRLYRSHYSLLKWVKCWCQTKGRPSKKTLPGIKKEADVLPDALVFLKFDKEVLQGHDQGMLNSTTALKKKTVCLPLSASAVSSPVLSTPTLLNVPKWTSRRRQFRSVKVCVGGCGCSLQCVYGSSLWAGKIFSPDVSQLVDRLCCTGLSWISQRSVLAHFQSEILSPVSQR